VARTAGVSRSTASRALNGGARVSPTAQAAVEAAVAALGFVPNRAARSLVTRKTGSIALVIPEPDGRFLADPFLASTLRGVSRALETTDLQLVLLVARPDDNAQRIARYLGAGHVDGAIIASHHRGNDLETAVARAHLPAVFIGRPHDGTNSLLWVDVDNRTAARTAAQRLVDARRRRIATITGPLDMSVGRDRFDGWRAALDGAGLPTDAWAEGDFTIDSGAIAMRDLIREHPDIDAVFVASDLMAQGALPILRAAGRSVPGDVAIVGFDDLGIAASTTPPLTTMRNPVEQMVRAATDALLDALEGTGSPHRPVRFQAKLIERASVV
jgi:DNA-binding LacI/PurR family transcriptional regulator